MIQRLLKLRFAGLSLFILASLQFAQAQTDITGTVTDALTGESIPGVNIIILGTSNGTVSDFEGNYSIAANESDVLVVSFVGYLTQELLVGNRSVIDIQLVEDVMALEEIVVTGYGVQEMKKVSSSITRVKEEDFNVGMVNSPAQLIQGKVAGLNITKPGGDPNDPFTIRLRGVTTFGGNQEPLVVVDGMVGTSLDAVDPADIASIDVLKDGSAAAIYGTRGSSGVLIVTTKAGEAGGFRMDYHGAVSFDDIERTMDFMNASEYSAQPGAVDLGSDTDWLKQVTQTGISHIHNLSLSGGTPRSTYRASVNFREVQGIQIRTGFQRINGRLNFTQKALNDRATFTLNLAQSNQERQFGPGVQAVFLNAVESNPTMPVLYDGTPGLVDVGGYAERNAAGYVNPRSLADQSVDEGTDLNSNGQLRFEYDLKDLLNGLRFTTSYSQQYQNELRGEYYPSTTKYNGANTNNGYAVTTTVQKKNQLFEAIGDWDGIFGNTEVAAVAGYSYQEFQEEGHGMAGGQFLTDAFSYHNMSASQDFDNGLGIVNSFKNTHKLVAFFSRVNLNFRGIWFLSASIRQEGSSRFGGNNKWGTFPALSAAVELSNLLSLSGFDNLKLRAGFGRTGAIPGASYLSLQRLGPIPMGDFFFNGNYVSSYGPVNNANPDLAWETKDELDVGLDFVLINERLTGSMDYYVRTITDMILPVSVPVPPNIFPQTEINIGKFKSNGFELAINWGAVKNTNFSYNLGLNFSTFKVKVESLTSGSLSFGEGGVLYRANMGGPGQNDTNVVRVKEGESFGDLWGPVWDGDSLDASGVPLFRDLDSDGSFCDCDADRAVIGNGLPDFSVGWNNAFSFGGGWYANLFFRGSFGHDLLNSYRGFYENTELGTLTRYNVVNTSFFNPEVKQALVNSIHVEKASFFKLDNMVIGYNFDISSSNTLSRIELYLAGQNLFTITDYQGIDPEVRYVDAGNAPTPFTDPADLTGFEDPLAPGIERRNTYFTTRTLTIGVKLGF